MNAVPMPTAVAGEGHRIGSVCLSLRGVSGLRVIWNEIRRLRGFPVFSGPSRLRFMGRGNVGFRLTALRDVDLWAP